MRSIMPIFLRNVILSQVIFASINSGYAQSLQTVTGTGNTTNNVLRLLGENNVGASGGGELGLIGVYTTPRVNDSRVFIGWKNSSNNLTDGLAGTLLFQGRSDIANIPIDFLTGQGTPQLRLRIAGNGNVGIGLSNPTAKLDISGSIRIADGSQGIGKVLTTNDATGLAIWRDNSFVVNPFFGTITVGGSESSYYPVTFFDAGWDLDEISTLEITRFNVHQDNLWKGSLVALIKFHTTHYGHGSNFIDVDLKSYLTAGYENEYANSSSFIAGWKDASYGDGNRRIIIWLKGNSTYKYRSKFNVSPVVYVNEPYNGWGGPYGPKTSVEPYVNNFGRNESSAFFYSNKPNYFKGNVGIGTSNPLGNLHLQTPNLGSALTTLRLSAHQDPVNYVTEFVNNYSSEDAFRITHGGSNLFRSSVSGYNFIEVGNSSGLKVNLLTALNRPVTIPSGRLVVGPPPLESSNNWVDVTNKVIVNGNIVAQKVRVTQTGWPDYVFQDTYPLLPLPALQAFIQKNKHLPEVPKEQEILEKGLDLGEMNAVLLKKIEELTLYIIQQDKRIEKLEKQQSANN